MSAVTQEGRGVVNESVGFHLVSGAVLGLAAGVSPGPLLTLVVTQTLQYGTREGVKVALAPMLTDLPIIVAALLLVVSLAEVGPVLGIISLLGGLYVGFLGWSTFRSGSGAARQDAPRPCSLKRGVAVNFLSPHPYLFWSVVGGPLLFQVLETSLAAAGVFLLLFYGGLVGSKMLLARLVGGIRGLLHSTWYRLTLQGLGLVLLLFAALLIRDGLGMLAG